IVSLAGTGTIEAAHRPQRCSAPPAAQSLCEGCAPLLTCAHLRCDNSAPKQCHVGVSLRGHPVLGRPESRLSLASRSMIIRPLSIRFVIVLTLVCAASA